MFVSFLRRFYWSAMRGLHGAAVHVALAQADRLDTLRQRHLQRNPLLRFGAKHFSQNDEDGLIEEICSRVLGDRTGSFIEIGVGDGIENNTLNLLSQGWSGVWLGGEPLRLTRTGPRLHFKQCWIDRENVSGLAHEAIKAAGIELPDLISVDLDGNDFDICCALLADGLRPGVWVVEYNGRFSTRTRWVMPYDRAHRWTGDDYFGSSLCAFHELFTKFGYRLVTCNLTGANAFFVHRDFSHLFADVPDDWRSVAMPANYVVFPPAGHPASIRTIESFLGEKPTDSVAP